MDELEHLTYEQGLDTLMEACEIKRQEVHLPLNLIRPVVAVTGKDINNPPISTGELKSLDIKTITDLDAVDKWFGLKPLLLMRALEFLKSV